MLPYQYIKCLFLPTRWRSVWLIKIIMNIKRVDFFHHDSKLHNTDNGMGEDSMLFHFSIEPISDHFSILLKITLHNSCLETPFILERGMCSTENN